MFGRFVNPIDPEVGRQYRQLVLEPNASLPAADMVRSFLGRDPSSDAFMVLRGLRDS
jgi:Zn-dependent oligopeptidase